jgi:hypothetical protein
MKKKEVNGFPPALLKRPWDERLQYFKGCKVPHERMASVLAQIRSAIRRRDGEGFIFVVGPTRIGKTTVFNALINELLRESMEQMRKDPGCLPVAGMEACNDPRGYEWKDHWIRSLQALNEPLIEHKVARQRTEYDELEARKLRENNSATILRHAFEEAARQRKTRVFCIDEAHHLALVAKARLHRAQIETIKSVASRSKALHAMFGTYDLLLLRNANGQLGARAITVHFNRYRPDSEKDLEAFADAALSLVPHMPLAETPDLRADMDYCFETSLGLVGLLKVWLTDALGDVLESGRRTLTRADLERNEPPLDVLDKISQEIVAGEQKLEQKEWARTLIRLRMRDGSKFKEPNQPEMFVRQQLQEKKQEGAADDREGAATPATKKKGRRVERRAKRDRVGAGRTKRAA